MSIELPADHQNHEEPPVLYDQISVKFSLWFSTKWLFANMLVWTLTVISIDYYFNENQIINLVGFLIILLPLVQWLVLRSYGDWGLSWVFVSALSVIILSGTIAMAIYLSLMCFPLTCLIVILVTVGYGAATTFVLTNMPKFPTWAPPTILVRILSLVIVLQKYY